MIGQFGSPTSATARSNPAHRRVPCHMANNRTNKSNGVPPIATQSGLADWADSTLNMARHTNFRIVSIGASAVALTNESGEMYAIATTERTIGKVAS